jgi:nicotinate-nucleotide pyrophosphorylase (carboxylating)
MRINTDEYILNALREDITSEDVTTNAIMPEDKLGEADLICKQDGIICGLPVFQRTFELLDDTAVFETDVKDGDFVRKGQKIGVIRGDIKALLTGERTALNYLQRMSGIATFTRELADELKDCKTKLLDTRKTTPNMRPFEKYAVKVGGGTNHRYNLSDGILIKDNHIGAAGSITRAVELAREYAPFVRKIEVEVETLEQLDEALAAGADIIMLDNMDNDTMREAVKRVDGRAQTECSGNVTKERLAEIAQIGVDFVSSGALTHSAPIMDLSLKNMKPVE